MWGGKDTQTLLDGKNIELYGEVHILDESVITFATSLKCSGN